MIKFATISQPLVRHRSVLLGALLIGAVWISLSFFLANERNSVERAEVQNSTNLAGALASHLSNSLGEVDRWWPYSRCAEILRQITDLFAAGSTIFGSEQTSLFDDVMGRLVSEIDHSARAAFGERIADLPNTPPRITRELALDDSIDVAGPMLRRSESVDRLRPETARAAIQFYRLRERAAKSRK
jgi:hypothetical protein